jgi:ubiquinone/menaquinone biosynthesis C-methylase UbiE
MAQDDDPKHLSQQRFGNLAQNYSSSTFHNHSYTIERLAYVVGAAEGKLALDVATGPAPVALAMAHKGAQIIASDLTIPMLKSGVTNFSKANILAQFVQADAMDLPFPNACVDIVTCRFAPHHFPDIPRFLKEAVRVLRPGGVLGIVDQVSPHNREASRYCNAFEKLRDPSHAWQLSQREWEKAFRAAGLAVFHSEATAARFDFAWWTGLQANTPETVLRLKVMLKQAPPPVAAWFDAEIPEEGAVTFIHRHALVAGRLKA